MRSLDLARQTRDPQLSSPPRHRSPRVCELSGWERGALATLLARPGVNAGTGETPALPGMPLPSLCQRLFTDPHRSPVPAHRDGAAWGRTRRRPAGRLGLLAALLVSLAAVAASPWGRAPAAVHAASGGPADTRGNNVYGQSGTNSTTDSAALARAGVAARVTGPRPLLQADFFGYQTSSSATVGNKSTYLTNDTHAVVAGTAYPHAIELAPFNTFDTVGISLNARKLAGYTAVSFDVGVEDRNPAGTVMKIVVTADGKTIFSATQRQGQLARQVVLPFGHAQVFSFTASEVSGGSHITDDFMLIGNPVALPGGAPAPAGTTLRLSSPSIAAGGRQTALVTAPAGASVTLVFDYPDGSQRVVGPTQADANGQLTDVETVPTGMQGAVQVVAISSAGGRTSIAQAAFTVQ